MFELDGTIPSNGRWGGENEGLSHWIFGCHVFEQFGIHWANTFADLWLCLGGQVEPLFPALTWDGAIQDRFEKNIEDIFVTAVGTHWSCRSRACLKGTSIILVTWLWTIWSTHTKDLRWWKGDDSSRYWRNCGILGSEFDVRTSCNVPHLCFGFCFGSQCGPSVSCAEAQELTFGVCGWASLSIIKHQNDPTDLKTPWPALCTG